MKGFGYNRLNIDKLVWFLLMLFVFTIPLNQQLSIKLFIVTLAFSFFVKKTKEFFEQYLFRSWDAMLYIAVLLIGLLYSKELQDGLQAVETSLSLIALPLIFSGIKQVDFKKIHILVSSFCLGLLLSALICVFYAIWVYTDTKEWISFFFDNLTGVIDFQPTYYAYYLIFGITCCLYALYYDLLKRVRWALIGLSVFFFLILLLTGGWTAMVSLFFVFSFFILKYFIDKKTMPRSIAALLIIVMLSGIFALDAFVATATKESIGNDYWERSILWKAALEINPNPFFGVGTGDSRYILNQYYHTYGMKKFEINSYNAHNQFVQTYFAQGIMGLIGLSFLLGRILYLAARRRKTIVILVLFPFVVYGITEAFFGRYQGVVFFALLHQIFLSYFYIQHSVQQHTG